MLKAIETVYKDYKFRSRVEARWAVYFDTMGFPWVYEPEGYDLDGVLYLPDFWLPQVKMWAEVKSEPFSEEEKNKCRLLADHSGHPCLMLDGTPDMTPYWAMEPSWTWEDGTEGPPEMDYVLSNHHDYPINEHRFYTCTCLNLDDAADCRWFREVFADMKVGIRAARQARFEHRKKLHIDLTNTVKERKWWTGPF